MKAAGKLRLKVEELGSDTKNVGCTGKCMYSNTNHPTFLK